jgi:hypothetical protein
VEDDAAAGPYETGEAAQRGGGVGLVLQDEPADQRVEALVGVERVDRRRVEGDEIRAALAGRPGAGDPDRRRVALHPDHPAAEPDDLRREQRDVTEP